MSQSQNSPESFDSKLDDKARAARANTNGIISEGMEWATRNQRFAWGQAAESNVLGLLEGKEEEVKKAIQDIQNSQLTELEALTDEMLLRYHDLVTGELTKRYDMIMQVTAEGSPAGESDDTVSTPEDLATFRERGIKMMENVQVEALVYQVLPKEAKGAYLEMIGKKMQDLQPDYFNVLSKTEKNEPLTQDDFDVLIRGVKDLGGKSMQGMRDAPIVAVLGSLKPNDRFTLLQQMSKDPDFPIFHQVVVTMVATNYLRKDEGLLVLNEKIALLSATPKDKRKNKKELTELERAVALTTSPEMEAIQQNVTKQREGMANYMETTAFGSRDRVGGLMTAEGVVGMAFGINGALGAGLNLAASLFGDDKMSLFLNPALWLSVGEVAVGLQLTHGGEGMLYTPAEGLATLLKNREEAANDKVAANLKNFADDLGNHPEATWFYVNYAPRIVDAYNAKRLEKQDTEPALTLADLGVTKKEDLPEAFRPLFDKKADLETTISGWATRFHREGGNGIAKPDAENQVRFIQEDRKSKTNGQEYVKLDLPPFNKTV